MPSNLLFPHQQSKKFHDFLLTYGESVMSLAVNVGRKQTGEAKYVTKNYVEAGVSDRPTEDYAEIFLFLR
ncbi:hypothetical protein M5689_008717 [Euphorbia peplus]|nr:hypothetical protein M5689_008717 [Euphorbia peplus]